MWHKLSSEQLVVKNCFRNINFLINCLAFKQHIGSFYSQTEMMRFNRMLIPLNISFFCTVCFFKSKSFTRNQAVKYATFSANLKKIRTVSYWNLNGAFSGRLCYLFLINTLLRDGFRGGHGGRALLFFAITCFFCDHFEELQTVLIQVKLIINNAPLT